MASGRKQSTNTGNRHIGRLLLFYIAALVLLLLIGLMFMKNREKTKEYAQMKQEASAQETPFELTPRQEAEDGE